MLGIMGMTPLATLLLVSCYGLENLSDKDDIGGGDTGSFFPPGETGEPDTGWHELDDTGDTEIDPNNRAPIADAGGDLAAQVGDVVDLDGSFSMDPDGDPLDFTWTLISKPAGSGTALINEDRELASVFVDLAGTFEVELVVSDGQLGDVDYAEIVVEAPNGDPVADAGADQLLSEGQTATLDGTASYDPDGDRLTYSWTLTSRPGTSLASLSNPASATPRFVADEVGIYEIQLVVSDGVTTSAPDAVRVQAQSSSTGGGGGGGGSGCNCGEAQTELQRRYPTLGLLVRGAVYLPALVLFGLRRREDDRAT